MRVKPLTGQVLIQLLPEEKQSAGGIELPDHTLSPEEVQEQHRHPTPPPGIRGRVVEIGPWPRLRNGMCLLPEFGRGSVVVIPPRAGIEMDWQSQRRLKMVKQSDVLAVLQ